MRFITPPGGMSDEHASVPSRRHHYGSVPSRPHPGRLHALGHRVRHAIRPLAGHVALLATGDAAAELNARQDPGQQRTHPAGRGAAGLDHLGVAQALPGQARRQVRDQRDGEHLGPELAGGDRLQHG